MTISNVSLAAKLDEVASGWRGFVEQQIDWLVNVGPEVTLTDPYDPLVTVTVKTLPQLVADYESLVEPSTGLIAQTQAQLDAANAAVADAVAAQSTFDGYNTTFVGYLSTAETSKTGAETARDAAQTYRDQAAGHASAAATSETNAASSASAAASSASAASTSASNANASAVAADNSKIAAQNAQTAAEAAAAEAAANGYDSANVAITGGTINGTTIGATTPGSGAFTTLSAVGNGSATVANLYSATANIGGILVGYNNTSANYYDADTHTFRFGNGGGPGLTLTTTAATFGLNVGIGATPVATGFSGSAVTTYVAHSNAAVVTLDSTATGRAYSFVSTATGQLQLFDEDAGLTRLTVTSAGKVGINTTAPYTELGVHGNAIFSGTNPFLAFAADQSGSTPAYIQRNNATGRLDIYAAGPLSLSASGVGIGTTGPGATLDVVRGTAAGGTAVFQGTVVSSHFNYSTTEDTYIRGGKVGSLVRINDAHAGNVLLAEGGGKVGFGIGNPQAVLHSPTASPLALGRWVYNAAFVHCDTSPAYFMVKTQIPFSGNDCPVRFRVHGFGYGGHNVDLDIQTYVYVNEFYGVGNITRFQSKVGYRVPTRIRLGTWNDGGVLKVALEIANDGIYWSGYSVDVYRHGNGADSYVPVDECVGWTTYIGSFDDHGSVTNVVTVPQAGSIRQRPDGGLTMNGPYITMSGPYTGYLGQADHLVSGQISTNLALRSDTDLILATQGSTPRAHLHSAGTSFYGSDGCNGFIGNVGHAGWAGFSHDSRRAPGDYALLQNASGETLLNASLNQKIGFRINNSEGMVFNSTGLGIGGIAPEQKLDVNGQVRTRSDFMVKTAGATDYTTYALGSVTRNARDGSGNGYNAYCSVYAAYNSTTAGQISLGFYQSSNGGTSHLYGLPGLLVKQVNGYESNVAFFDDGSMGFGGGKGVIAIAAGTAPTSNPAYGFLLYVDPADNKLKARGSSGTITTLASP